MPFADSTPALELLEDGRRYRVLEPIHWIPRKPNREGLEPVRVPPGHTTDFASVPRFLWAIFPPAGRYSLAAIVHDWLCEVRPYDWPSKKVHLCFLVIMRDLGVNAVTRRLMYWGVRIGGPRW